MYVKPSTRQFCYYMVHPVPQGGTRCVKSAQHSTGEVLITAVAQPCFAFALLLRLFLCPNPPRYSRLYRTPASSPRGARERRRRRHSVGGVLEQSVGLDDNPRRMYMRSRHNTGSLILAGRGSSGASASERAKSDLCIYTVAGDSSGLFLQHCCSLKGVSSRVHVKVLHPGKGDLSTPKFLALNVDGKLPLATFGPEGPTQHSVSGALHGMLLIEHRFPRLPLLPERVGDRAEVMRFLDRFDMLRALHLVSCLPAMDAGVADRIKRFHHGNLAVLALRDGAGAAHRAVAVEKQLNRELDELDAQLQTSTFLSGGTFGVCDMVAFWELAAWQLQGSDLELELRPHLARWFQDGMERRDVQKLWPQEWQRIERESVNMGGAGGDGGSGGPASAKTVRRTRSFRERISGAMGSVKRRLTVSTKRDGGRAASKGGGNNGGGTDPSARCGLRKAREALSPRLPVKRPMLTLASKLDLSSPLEIAMRRLQELARKVSLPAEDERTLDSVMHLLSSARLFSPDLSAQQQLLTDDMDKETREWFRTEIMRGGKGGGGVGTDSLQGSRRDLLARSSSGASGSASGSGGDSGGDGDGDSDRSRAFSGDSANAAEMHKAASPSEIAHAAARKKAQEAGEEPPPASPAAAALKLPPRDEAVLTALAGSIGDWSLDMNAQKARVRGRPLFYVTLAALRQGGVMRGYKAIVDAHAEAGSWALSLEERLTRFLSEIEHRYTVAELPYHNSYHAADVVNSMTHLLRRFKGRCTPSLLEQWCGIIAAAVHDARVDETRRCVCIIKR